MRRKRVHRKEERIDGTNFTVELPVPPSTNALTFNRKQGGRSNTKEYEAWIASAGLLVNAAVNEYLPRGPWGVVLKANVGHNRDIDNLVKPTIDLLVTWDIIGDDRYVEEGEYSRLRNTDYGLLEKNWMRVTVYPCFPNGKD